MNVLTPVFGHHNPQRKAPGLRPATPEGPPSTDPAATQGSANQAPADKTAPNQAGSMHHNSFK